MDNADIRQRPELIRVIQAVAHEPVIGRLETEIIDVRVGRPIPGLAKQHARPQRPGIARRERLQDSGWQREQEGAGIGAAVGFFGLDGISRCLQQQRNGVRRRCIR